MLFWRSEVLFVKAALIQHLYDSYKIKFWVYNILKFVEQFYLVSRCDIASEYGFLMMFEVFFASFEHFDGAVFADVAEFVRDVVKQKDVIIIYRMFFHIFSFKRNGKNALSSKINFMSL